MKCNEVKIKVDKNIDFENEKEILKYCMYNVYKQYQKILEEEQKHPKVPKCHDLDI